MASGGSRTEDLEGGRVQGGRELIYISPPPTDKVHARMVMQGVDGMLCRVWRGWASSSHDECRLEIYGVAQPLESVSVFSSGMRSQCGDEEGGGAPCPSDNGRSRSSRRALVVSQFPWGTAMAGIIVHVHKMDQIRSFDVESVHQDLQDWGPHSTEKSERRFYQLVNLSINT